MNAPKKKQGNNRPKIDNARNDLAKSSQKKSEQNNDSLQAETEALEFPEKHGITANTKELLKILSVIALRIAAKRQKQEHRNTNT